MVTIEQQIKDMEKLLSKNFISRKTKMTIRSVVKTLKDYRKHLSNAERENNVIVSMSMEEWKKHSKTRKF